MNVLYSPANGHVDLGNYFIGLYAGGFESCHKLFIAGLVSYKMHARTNKHT